MSYSTKTHRKLKTMYKNGSINRNLITPSDLHRLFQDNYIINSTNYHDENVYLTEAGRAYIEEVKLDKHRFWIPVAISIIAFFRPEITSIIKYFVTLIAEK